MCFTPTPSDNSTLDRCCFDSQECANTVCGSQNSSTIIGDGTIYCDLNATTAQHLMEHSATCGTTIGCLYAKRSPQYTNSSMGDSERMIDGNILLGWIMIVLFIGLGHKRLY